MRWTSVLRRRGSVWMYMTVRLRLRTIVWTTAWAAVRPTNMPNAWATRLPSIRRWHRATARRCNAWATRLPSIRRWHRATTRRRNDRDAKQCLVHTLRRCLPSVSRRSIAGRRRGSAVTLVFVGGRHDADTTEKTLAGVQRRGWPAYFINYRAA